MPTRGVKHAAVDEFVFLVHGELDETILRPPGVMGEVQRRDLALGEPVVEMRQAMKRSASVATVRGALDLQPSLMVVGDEIAGGGEHLPS